MQVYSTVKSQYESSSIPQALLMIVSGTAGTGKSYLIHCLYLLLKDMLCVAAPTGIASFNIQGHTLHSLFSLPTKSKFKQFEGNRLHELQQSFCDR